MKIQLITSEQISQLTAKRNGETKIGETVQSLTTFNVQALAESSARFVFIGIREDIGPRANLGRAGAHSSWDSFLPKFLNMQSNRFLNGSDCLILGSIDLNGLTDSNEIEDLRTATSKMDQIVTDTLSIIHQAKKIPVIIGGGHNNSYSNIKAAAINSESGKINCINIDPHADFRPLEGRHSGNGFSYAFDEGFLKHYAIVGLHEGYNSENMLNALDNKKVSYTTFEAIFILEEINFNSAISKELEAVNNDKYGVEVDLDAIENVASSAQTPSGITPTNARRFVHKAGASKNACYMHLCEAAPSLSNQPDQVGKLLAYLAADFVKSRNQF
jgi:formiminoglutamase